jgi:hypothetical protein
MFVKLINYMELIPTWEANSRLAGQEILRHLWNGKVFYLLTKSLLLDPT